MSKVQEREKQKERKKGRKEGKKREKKGGRTGEEWERKRKEYTRGKKILGRRRIERNKLIEKK